MIATPKNFIGLNISRGESDLKNPPGYENRPADLETIGSGKEKMEILQNKAWQVAISPASSIFMNFIMFWMVGNSLSIYTLFFIFTMISSQVKALFGTGEKFKEFEIYKLKELGFYKLIYFSLNLSVFAFCLYKLSGIGLLPLSPSDYVDLLPENNTAISIVRFNHN